MQVRPAVRLGAWSGVQLEDLRLECVQIGNIIYACSGTWFTAWRRWVWLSGALEGAECE